jgi:alcohol dehydrogenase
MQFFMPTKLYEGKGVVKEKGYLFREIGTKALIVTGRASSKKNGSLRDAVDTLEANKIAYCIFDEIEENPSLETVERAAQLGRAEGANFVVGIGGGSPLDAAKAIGILIKHKHVTKETLIGHEPLDALPVVVIPTTAGTGSEVTQYAILTDHKEKTKKNIGHQIFPSFALLDASYMMGMPNQVTVDTAVDAMSHLVESYLNKNTTPLSEMAVEKGLQLWGECIPALMKKEFSYETRQKLLLASTLGGIAIAQTGTSLPHGMGYHLTYFKGMPHGLANGVLYKAYLKCFKDQSKVLQIHKMLGLESHEALESVLDCLCESKITLSKQEIEQFAKGMCENKAKLKNHPEEIDYVGVYGIYKQSFILQ